MADEKNPYVRETAVSEWVRQVIDSVNTLKLDPGIAATAVAAAQSAQSAEAITLAARDDTISAALQVSGIPALISTSKNLLDTSTGTHEAYWDGRDLGSAPVAVANHWASALVPVVAGTQYTIQNIRTVQFNRLDGTIIAGTYSNVSASTTRTVTAPVDAVFAAFSVEKTNNRLAVAQVETGPTATSYERFGIVTDKLIVPGGYLPEALTDINSRLDAVAPDTSRVILAGDAFTVAASLAGEELLMKGWLRDPSFNRGFQLNQTTLGGVLVHSTSDDATPINTNMGFIGASHGYFNVGSFANPDGKTVTDLGSVWTDGTRQYVLLAIEGGNLIVGGDYTAIGGRTDSAPATDTTADLVHVSGATHTGTIPNAGKVRVQLYPSTRPYLTAVMVDGKEVSGDGEYPGKSIEIRFSYAVLSYASIYDTAKANIGTSYVNLPVKSSMLVTETYAWSGPLCVVDTTLTAMEVVKVNSYGVVQAIPLNPKTNTTRYLPGVGVAGGANWTVGVSLASNVSTTFTSVELVTPGIPPAFHMDVLNGTKQLGFAMGYFPAATGKDTSDQPRMATSASNLYSMTGSTGKMYPRTALATTLSPGQRLSGKAFRAYLTQEQVGKVLAWKGSAPDAFAALSPVLG